MSDSIRPTKFEFHGVSRIVFGRGHFAKAGALAMELGKSAIVLFNGSEAIVQRLAEQLDSASTRHVSVRQRGEPTVEDIDRALETARRERCDLAIGVGGGSAIDAAKAVAGLLGNGGSALDYMEVIGKGKKFTRPAVPWIAIPTTAGTGAEVTRNAVIGYPQKQYKASLRSEHLLAKIALIDPALGVDVPHATTARTGMDALCQCIEAYTSTGAQPMTDALALEGIDRAGRSLLTAFKDGTNLEAREDMAMAALLSGIALANAGLGAVHGFASPLGAGFPIPHGTACAALLPYVMSANVKALHESNPSHPTLARYAVIGHTLSQRHDLNEPEAIESGIDFVRQLSRHLKIEPLRNFNFSESDIAPTVALARKASSMRYNPIALSDAMLEGILKAAL
jgi:alcohol dehydrogenase class IV